MAFQVMEGVLGNVREPAIIRVTARVRARVRVRVSVRVRVTHFPNATTLY